MINIGLEQMVNLCTSLRIEIKPSRISLVVVVLLQNKLLWFLGGNIFGLVNNGNKSELVNL